jgi:hypothetical protein
MRKRFMIWRLQIAVVYARRSLREFAQIYWAVDSLSIEVLGQ